MSERKVTDAEWAEQANVRTRRLVRGLVLFALGCLALGGIASSCGLAGDHEPWHPNPGPPLYRP